MTTPWDVLGIDRDADEREIKRAYARLLKVHRPDADPEGFRRIRDAYEVVLAGVGPRTPPIGLAAVDDPPVRPPMDDRARASAPPPGATPEKIDQAALALIADIATPDRLDQQALRDSWVAAVVRLLQTRPEQVAAVVPPVVAARAAARGCMDAARGLWSCWREGGDRVRQMAFAEAWLAECSGTDGAGDLTLLLAHALAVTAPELAGRLGQEAFRAEPAVAARRFSASGLDHRLAMGRECARSEPGFVEWLDAALAGEADGAEGLRFLSSLMTLPRSGRTMAWLCSALPELGSRVLVERELRTLTPAARSRLGSALENGRWDDSVDDEAQSEIMRSLIRAKRSSALVQAVARSLPALAEAVRRARTGKAVERNRHRSKDQKAVWGQWTVAVLLGLLLAMRQCHEGMHRSVSTGGRREAPERYAEARPWLADGWRATVEPP